MQNVVKLKYVRTTIFTYTMILLMGMWISLTKKPINPIIAKPIAVAMAIFWNSTKKKKNKPKNFSLGHLVYGTQEEMCTMVTRGERSLYQTVM